MNNIGITRICMAALCVCVSTIGTVRAEADHAAIVAAQQVIGTSIRAIRDAQKDSVLSRAALRAYVRERVIPYFAVRTAAQSVAGKVWSDMTDAQRDRFTAVFLERMLQIYTNALEHYDKQKILFKKNVTVHNDGTVDVSSILVMPSKSRIPIVYHMMHKDGAWRIFDLSVDGISMTGSYRAAFAKQFAITAIDTVIDDFAAANARNDAQAESR